MNPLFLYAGFYSGAAALLKLAGFLLALGLARALSLEEYSQFGLLYAVQTGVVPLALTGVVESIVPLLKADRTPEHRSRQFAAANGAFGVMAVAAVLVVIVIHLLVSRGSGIALPTLGAVIASGLLTAFASLQARLVRLEERHLLSICFSFVAPAAGLAGAFAAFLRYQTIQSFFFGNAAGLVAALLVLRAGRWGFYRVGVAADAVRPILAGSPPFLAMAFFGWLSGYGNNYLISLLLGSSEVARFTFALTLSSVMQLVAAALDQVWAPRFFRIVHELPPDGVERQNHRMFGLQAVVMGLLGAAVMVLYPVLSRWAGGNLEAYRSLRLEVFLLLSAYVLLCPWWHSYNYFLAHGKGSALLRVSLATSAIGIPLGIGLIFLLGPIGIYVGFCCQMVIRSLGIVLNARKSWPIRINWAGVAVGVAIVYGGLLVSRALSA